MKNSEIAERFSELSTPLAADACIRVGVSFSVAPFGIQSVLSDSRVGGRAFPDLIVIEASACNLGGVVIWGAHRDSTELAKLGLPVFSYGSWPVGPLRLDERSTDAFKSARFGEYTVTRNDVVFGDLDGVLFVPYESVNDVLQMAELLWETERTQADAVRSGRTLREQLRFDEYLARRKLDPDYDFRKHLRAIGGAIEE